MLCVSIIMPTLNEEGTIEFTLERLRQRFPQSEIIVVDGGSSDNTVALAKQHARVLVSQKGRANQMNTGAAAALGDILWFIHADSYVDEDALAHIQKVMQNKDVIGGGLMLRFEEESKALRLIAKLSNIRAQHLQWIFGDQSMFVRRTKFEAIGGFPSIPIMEDLEISRLLKKQGKLVMLPAVSKTSARRFLEHGTWRTITRMQSLKLQYFLGVPPEDLLLKYSRKSMR